MKTCLVCETPKLTYQFYPRHDVCRECVREKLLEARIEAGELAGKRCNTCGKLKPLTDYYARYAKCKLCKRAVARKRQEQR